MKKYLALCLCALLALASCTQEIEGDGLDARDQARQALTGQTVTLDAYDADAALATKTSRADDGSVLWSPGDKISLFYGSGSNGGCEFTSTNQEPASRVQFTGEINVITGLSEGTEDIMFWGVYPYDIDNSCNGSTVTMWLHDSQRAADNTWADREFPAIGHSSGLAMGFYSLCGGLIFYLTEDGINRIAFSGKNDEVIAGPVTVAFSEGVPTITSFLSTQKEISLLPPSSYGTTAAYDSFKKTTPGDTTWYFMVIPPMTFTNGHTVTFYKNDGTYGVREFGTRTVTRNRFARIRSAALNNGVEFQALPLDNNQIRYTATEQVDYYIPQESTTGNEVVSNTWDSVTGLGIITFADAITVLDNHAFADMNGLISITLPDGLKDIGSYTFEGCNNLATVNMPNSVNHIGRLAFDHCTALESIHIPLLTGIGVPNPFTGCTNLKSFSGPHASADGKFLGFHFDDPTQAYLASCAIGAFKNQELVLPEVKEIGAQACYGGEFTGTLTIPGTVVKIGEEAFAGCTKVNTIILEHSDYTNASASNGMPELPTLGEHAFDTYGTTLCTIKIPGGLATASNAKIYQEDDVWYGYLNQVVAYQADNEIWLYAVGTGGNPCPRPTGICDAEGTSLSWKKEGAVLPTGFDATYYSHPTVDVEPIVPYPTSMPLKPITILVYSGDIAGLSTFNPGESVTFPYISLPHSVEQIGDEAFKDNTALLTFPSDGYNLQVIGNKAFQGCTAMAGKIELWHREYVGGGIPQSSIGSYAFQNCTGIEEVTLNACAEIGGYAFEKCTALTTVNAEDPFQIIGPSAFEDCSSLTSFKPVGYNDDGLLVYAQIIRRRAFASTALAKARCYTDLLETSVFLWSSIKSVTINGAYNTSTVVKKGALGYCPDLKTVNIPAVTGDLEEDIFFNCPNLTTLTLGATAIPDEYFSGFTSLKTVKLPKVVTIGSKAFAFTRNLTSLYLGPNLETRYDSGVTRGFGAFVFYDDSNDNNVRNYNKLHIFFAGGVPSGESYDMFYNESSSLFKFAKIHVTAANLEAFERGGWYQEYDSDIVGDYVP